MKFEEFETLARLHAIDALEAEEIPVFESARAQLGEAAEEAVREAGKLNTLLALSLEPVAPCPGRKKKLLRALRTQQEEV